MFVDDHNKASFPKISKSISTKEFCVLHLRTVKKQQRSKSNLLMTNKKNTLNVGFIVFGVSTFKPTITIKEKSISGQL